MKRDHAQAVQAYVRRHLSETIRVRDIAVHLGLNASYLNTAFHAQTGMSVKAYVHKCKTDEACRLLRQTAYSLTEIAAMLGYFDQSHFSRIFKRYAGATPLQYRMR